MVRRGEPDRTHAVHRRAFAVRDAHRTHLFAHFVILGAVLSASLLANRFLTPSVLWAQWVALPAGIGFAAHLVAFARSTLATMSARQRSPERSR